MQRQFGRASFTHAFLQMSYVQNRAPLGKPSKGTQIWKRFETWADLKEPPPPQGVLPPWETALPGVENVNFCPLTRTPPPPRRLSSTLFPP